METSTPSNNETSTTAATDDRRALGTIDPATAPALAALVESRHGRADFYTVAPDGAVTLRAAYADLDPSELDALRGYVAEHNAAAWRPITATEPAQGQLVLTHIDDGRGVRNEAPLYRQGSLWFVADGGTYVYYAPTHYKPLPPVTLDDGYYWVTLFPYATPQVVQVMSGTGWADTPTNVRRTFVLTVGWDDRVPLDKFLADHPGARWSGRLVPSAVGPGVAPAHSR